MATFANRVQMTVSGTPGTGTITLGSASSGYRTFASAYGGNATVDVLIVDGTAWEVARGCTYTNSGTTLSRGTLESSSTGSVLSLSSSAVVSVILTASRITELDAKVSAIPTAASFSTSVSFASVLAMPQQSVSSVLSFTVDTTGAVDGAYVEVDLIADGTNEPTFSSDFREWGGSMGYDNRAGIRNCLTMWRRSGVYWYSWMQAVGATAEPTPATAVTISGPSSGVVSVASSAFTVGANGAITGTVTVTPSDGGGGGTFAPSSVDISSGTPTATFTYTPASTGAKSIALTNNGGLSNPSAWTYTSNAAATAPGTVQSLAAGTATSTSVPLTWTAPASDGGSAVTDYVVQWSAAGAGVWSTFSDGTTATTDATVTGLTPSTAYDFRVAAVNAVGQGSYVTVAGVSTAASEYLRGNTATARGSISESGDGTSGWTYTTGNTGNAWNSSFIGLTTPTLPVGAWVSMDIASTALDRALIGVSTSASVGAFASISLDGVWNGGDGVYWRIVSGGGAASTGVALAAGNRIRLRRTASTTVVAERSTDGGATWPTTVHTWTVSSGTLYVHFYPQELAGNNRCGPLRQNGMV